MSEITMDSIRKWKRDSELLEKVKKALEKDSSSLKAEQPCMQWIFNYDIDDIDGSIHETEKMAIENIKEYLEHLINVINTGRND